MKDTFLALFSGFTGPELAVACAFLAVVFALGVGLGASLRRRRRGGDHFIPRYRRF